MSKSPLFSLFFLLLLLLNAANADAQPSPSSYKKKGTAGPYSSNLNTATAVLVVLLIFGFLFIVFFSVYFRHCCNSNRSSVIPAAPGAVTTSRRGARRGLDPEILETIPTLSYSAVNRLKIGTESLECAVCLSEFTEDQTLRMLPKCCHVFHTECIDTWLESHVTCPVCRANLTLVDSTEGVVHDEPPCEEEEGHEEGEVVIDIGHVGGDDRYTLRLPEHVRREIVEAGSLRRSASMAVFWNGGEGSFKGGYRRAGSLGVGRGLTERWTAGILARVSTWRRGEVTAEGSVKRGESSSGDVGN